MKRSSSNSSSSASAISAKRCATISLTIASDQSIHEALASCGLRPDARAEQLPLAQFAKLFAALGATTP